MRTDEMATHATKTIQAQAKRIKELEKAIQLMVTAYNNDEFISRSSLDSQIGIGIQYLETILEKKGIK